jgi:hypothetical protein
MTTHGHIPHTHPRTGKLLDLDWIYDDLGTRADWSVRVRCRGKPVDLFDGTVSFDPNETSARSAVLMQIRRQVDREDYGRF